MEPKIRNHRDLRNLQRAINNKRSLFGPLKNLIIDLVEGTINGKEVTKLGDGGNGNVYKIYHEGQWKALKIDRRLHQGESKWITNGGDHLILEAFGDENTRLAAITYIYYSNAGGSVVLSELCERGNWKKEQSDDRVILEENLMLLLSALKALHDRNIIHGDIKPSNILISGDGLAKFADFGITVVCNSDGFGQRHGGTFNYMAPEVRSDHKSEDTDSMINLKAYDCWSLGITLCEKILHKNPYSIFAEKQSGPDTSEEENSRTLDECIINNPEVWTKFISDELDSAVPPTGRLLRFVIVSLLDPHREKALSIDDILRTLDNLSRSDDLSRAEYKKLCEKSTERIAKDLERRKEQNEQRLIYLEQEKVEMGKIREEAERRNKERMKKLESAIILLPCDTSVLSSDVIVPQQAGTSVEPPEEPPEEPVEVEEKESTISVLSGRVKMGVTVDGTLDINPQLTLSSDTATTLTVNYKGQSKVPSI